MEHAVVVENELFNKGFKARVVVGQMVEVSLSNRKVSQMEVRQALEETFEEIEFSLANTANGVLVTV
jgi:sensor domain CHASE-containing protein